MSHPIEKACPTCAADAGQPCVGKRGHARKSFHRNRGSKREAAPIGRAEGLRTESPIEIMLVNAIKGWIDHNGANATVDTQMEIGPFRADIVVAANDERVLVIECDGAAFHCSEEQVQRDKRRDRYMVARGVSVMRFSGKEIHKDVRGCAAEVGLWIHLK